MVGVLTSDDMQDEASSLLLFLLKYQELVKIGPKNFLDHFLRFFVHALLHPMSYAPGFCQMNDLIRIYTLSGYKFHQYNVCGCEVKNFQSFLY